MWVGLVGNVSRLSTHLSLWGSSSLCPGDFLRRARGFISPAGGQQHGAQGAQVTGLRYCRV